MRHAHILEQEHAVLLVVDVQDAFLKAIWEPERVVENSLKLIEAAKVLSVPTLVTVQYSQRMGGTTQALEEALVGCECIDKMTFSCLGSEAFASALDATGRRQVLICGIETHVCVNQTAHDLLARGLMVHIAQDAVSSRTESNWRIGMQKMRDSGCVITSTEAAIFELLRDASRPEFKRILPIVK
jgi:nicotinamidase-related amidase